MRGALNRPPRSKAPMADRGDARHRSAMTRKLNPAWETSGAFSNTGMSLSTECNGYSIRRVAGHS
jgi:hypothetical protein